MVSIEFIEDFATKKKGDKLVCDSMLASQLVRIDKVAKYSQEEETAVKQNVKRGKK